MPKTSSICGGSTLLIAATFSKIIYSLELLICGFITSFCGMYKLNFKSRRSRMIETENRFRKAGDIMGVSFLLAVDILRKYDRK